MQIRVNDDWWAKVAKDKTFFYTFIGDSQLVFW